MTRVPKAAEAEFAGKEEMVQGIIAVLDRTFASSGRAEGLASVADFFRVLDEPTLRAIAYTHGVFEEDLEPTEEDHPRE
jgi:hypothetical protein